MEVRLQEVAGSVSGNLLPIRAGGQEAGGTACQLSTFHPGAVGASRLGEAQRERGAVLGSLGHWGTLVRSSDPAPRLPLLEPGDGGIHGAGESPGSPGWSGRLATAA